MTVSVIIPSYNDPRRLADALASVQAQTLQDWEAVVIDDGSQDQNAIVAAVRACNDPRIQLGLSKRNRGAGRSRNIGIRLARNRFLAFLDCDDLWKPDKLSLQIAHLRTTGAALSCTAYSNLHEKTGESHIRRPPAEISYDDLLGHNVIGCSTVMLDRDKLGRSYFPDIRMRQDFAHWLQVLRSGHKVMGLDEVLTIRRVYPGSLSGNKARAVWNTWRMYRDVMGLGPGQALAPFTRYLWYGFRGR